MRDQVRAVLWKLPGVVLLLGLLFGAFVVVVAPFEMFRKVQAEGWPSRSGTITQSYASHKRSAKGAWFWRPEICGTYRPNGERFCVTRVRFGGFRMGDGRASTFDEVARYPVGRDVNVYYDPNDPGETILEARSSWRELETLFGLGVGCLLMPVMLWAIGRIRRVRSEPR